MKTLHVLVCAGFAGLVWATPVQAAQSSQAGSTANDPADCSLGLQNDSCTRTLTPTSLSAQMALSLRHDKYTGCMETRCALADIGAPGMASSQDGATTFQAAGNPDTSSGPSDRAGYYLLGAIPLIVGVGGLVGIDHRLPNDDSGIWKRSRQLDLEYAVIGTEIAGSLWLGGQSRLGRTFWQSVDASVFSGVTAQVLKYTFSRARPYQSESPGYWFQGNCCQSFPSGEVTLQASFVTPFILEYQQQDPWVWALEALPLYDAVARVKVQGHWQTDVLAGWALGTAFGIFAHNRQMPFFLGYMPDGIVVGWQKSF
ncbi:MAG: phosphatase PAP2 family protein [Gammaproteobacteria bacterium]